MPCPLFSGADPDLADDSGNTPVHAAAFSGSARALRVLLEEGRADGGRHNLESRFASINCILGYN